MSSKFRGKMGLRPIQQLPDSSSEATDDEEEDDDEDESEEKEKEAQPVSSPASKQNYTRFRGKGAAILARPPARVESSDESTDERYVVGWNCKSCNCKS